jgi:hypothetical protein
MTDQAPADGTDPILSLGWFRTGSTFLFRVLESGLEDTRHYYEPFNPLIPNLFGSNRDLEEIFAGKQDLFEPYRDRESIVEEWFDPLYGQSNFFLDGEQRHGELDRYLVELADTDGPVHFQMNRALGRLDYLRGLFPSARVLLIVRSPWATWCSWHGYPEDPYDNELPGDKFQQSVILKELAVQLPDESQAFWGLDNYRSRHPLDNFLSLWGFLHYLVLQQIDDFPHYHLLRYEDFVREFDQSIELIEKDLDVSLDRTDLPDPHEDSVDRWREHFDEDQLATALERLPGDAPIRSMLQQLEYLPG